MIMKTWDGIMKAENFQAEVHIWDNGSGEWYGEGTMLMEDGMTIVDGNIFEHQTNIGKIIIKNINYQCGINGYKFYFVIAGNPKFL